MKKVFTLAMVFQDSNLLLGFKKRGFGEGKWNGFGGKVNSGETIEHAAKRELLEESGLTALSLKKQGILTFEFVGNPVAMEVHVFVTYSFSGTPTETEEMNPKWYSIDKLPYSDMWVDDGYWLPLLLQGKPFQGHFKFLDNDTILEYKLQELQFPPD